jgi:hypothetical protein
MNPIEPIEVNLPWQHVPHCACDDGSGPAWKFSQKIFAVAKKLDRKTAN